MPTPGVVSIPVVPNPVEPTARGPVVVGDVEVVGVEPGLDEVSAAAGLCAVGVVAEVPIDAVGEVPTVLVELVEPLKLPADVGELALSPVPVLPMLDGELIAPG